MRFWPGTGLDEISAQPVTAVEQLPPVQALICTADGVMLCEENLTCLRMKSLRVCTNFPLNLLLSSTSSCSFRRWSSICSSSPGSGAAAAATTTPAHNSHTWHQTHFEPELPSRVFAGICRKSPSSLAAAGLQLLLPPQLHAAIKSSNMFSRPQRQARACRPDAAYKPNQHVQSQCRHNPTTPHLGHRHGEWQP